MSVMPTDASTNLELGPLDPSSYIREYIRAQGTPPLGRPNIRAAMRLSIVMRHFEPHLNSPSLHHVQPQLSMEGLAVCAALSMQGYTAENMVGAHRRAFVCHWLTEIIVSTAPNNSTCSKRSKSW